MKHNPFLSLVTCVLAIIALSASQAADKKLQTMDVTGISSDRHGFLVQVGGKMSFRAKVAPETVWNLRFTKDGVIIAKAGRKKEPLLGIDPKTKQLALFDEPGMTTTWQVTSAEAFEIRPPRPFKGLLSMRVGDEDLRLSSDENGTPILGGKADVLLFLRDGP